MSSHFQENHVGSSISIYGAKSSNSGSVAIWPFDLPLEFLKTLFDIMALIEKSKTRFGWTKRSDRVIWRCVLFLLMVNGFDYLNWYNIPQITLDYLTVKRRPAYVCLSCFNQQSGMFGFAYQKMQTIDDLWRHRRIKTMLHLHVIVVYYINMYIYYIYMHSILMRIPFIETNPIFYLSTVVTFPLQRLRSPSRCPTWTSWATLRIACTARMAWNPRRRELHGHGSRCGGTWGVSKMVGF